MAIKYNGTALTDISYNGTAVNKVVKDGVTVFEKGTATETFSSTTQPPASTTTIGYKELVCNFTHNVTKIISVKLTGLIYDNTVSVVTKNVVLFKRRIDNTTDSPKYETLTTQLTDNKLTFKATSGGSTSASANFGMEITYEYAD